MNAEFGRGRRFDVIVVGVGAMGSSACYHLARHGVKVLGLEQFDIPHALGSSHGGSRMIRMAYYEHPDYVPLLRRAYVLWNELEQETGQKLLYITGGLYVGPPDGQLVSGSLRSAQDHGLPHDLLNAQMVKQRFPCFHVPGDWKGLYEPNAGFLVPERAVVAYADAALRYGAELHGRETVLEWVDNGDGITIRTRNGCYFADRVIFCAGAWTGKLLSDLGIKMRVTRQVMGWVWPRKPAVFAMGEFPVWASENVDGSVHYGFPMMSGGSDGPGLKIAWHGIGSETDPDHVVRESQPGDEETFCQPLNGLLPDANGPTLAIRTCLYTNSPDQHFILDRHPNHPRAIIACGFSSHGFKFASVIGEIMSDLILQNETGLPINFLSIERLR